jgi:hypothetical protein
LLGNPTHTPHLLPPSPAPPGARLRLGVRVVAVGFLGFFGVTGDG